ncbi:MAG: efflux RND transporter periplasmic adaptor subunit [Methylocystis sp.]|nr:efflux RND transporter periplasmic adaptor subunit [Methylocystis sp.]MCA3589803.1 efflux RND transporter periplasmic adaptor subunit [Methylocystis sp.]MCA3591598.1 efflux RND transporter periplasmic adaptor subunit [Methylocystis sp.]
MFRLSAAGAALLTLSLGSAFGAEAAKASGERAAPSVTVSTVARQPITDTVIVTGTLVPREEIVVAVQIEGHAINEILVEEGDRVTAGQVLARLSREIIDSALAQNKAQIARAEAGIASARSSIVEAEANLAQAQSSFQRTQALRNQGIASAETYDLRQAAAQQTEARVLVAREQLRLAEADKALAEAQRGEWMIRSARTEIKAPADGIISRRTARIGSIATSVGEPLFRIIKDGAIELEADVAETNLARMAIGQKAMVRPAGRDVDLAASVRLIAPEITKTTRLGRVRLALDKPDGLTIGSFGRGIIEISRKDAVVAPLSAVLFTAEGPRVQVVKDGVVESRTIVPGVRAGGLLEVVSGLQPGDQIVTISGTFLRNGDRITPIAAK